MQLQELLCNAHRRHSAKGGWHGDTSSRHGVVSWCWCYYCSSSLNLGRGRLAGGFHCRDGWRLGGAAHAAGPDRASGADNAPRGCNPISECTANTWLSRA